jgi:site-specific DNA-methyltransferase (adenine-specific)
MLNQINYNPDVLDCLANLSNDEVFTSPELANKILDLLPQELFQNKSITFLDPVTKTGIFLREIAKRLMKGLEEEIPDKNERINHIFKKQIFGIAITNLTSLVARRSVYCSKTANGKYSICESFESEQGNILFSQINHIWKNRKCIYCGANSESYDRSLDLETHAYQFIHTKNPKEIFNMRFDVIVGNPPYQLNDGGGTGDSAKPIYNKFIEQAKKLNPRFISMIIPSRWMKGGKGLNTFRHDMINDRRLKIIYDFENAKECFPGINLDGGVCYFLWEKTYNGELDFYYKPKEGVQSHSKRHLKTNISETVIRDFRQIKIIEKIQSKQKDKFSSIVSSRKPFSISTDFFNSPQNYGYSVIPTEPFKSSYKIYGVKGNKGGAKRVVGYIEKGQIPFNDSIKKYKLFQSYAYTTTSTIPPKIILGAPNEVCTETFLNIGPFETEEEALNCIGFTKTKFYRALLFFNRIQKNLSKSTFDFIPLLTFEKKWTDVELYKKYRLTQEEIDFIELTIKPMDQNNA